MTTGEIAMLVFGAVLAFWMLGAYNRLVGLRNTIAVAWLQVDEPLQRRRAVLQPMLEALRARWPEDPAVLAAVEGALVQVHAAADAVRQRPADAAATATLVTAEGVLAAATARLIALLEHHPEARDGVPQVAEALRAFGDIEQRHAFGRQLFNDAARCYNDAARQFPTRLLTPLFGFGLAGRL